MFVPVKFRTDPTGSGMSAGSTAEPQVQPSGQGPQPSTAAAPQGDGFWGRFPNIPEDQRPLLEPHLRDVQGYVTQMEMKQAPFKPLMDGGYTPEDVNGLVRFARDFERQPQAVWLNMAAKLQEQGVLHEDLDIEELTRIVTGQPDPETPQAPGVQQPQQPGEPMPDWAQQLMQVNQEMRSRLDERDQRDQQQAIQRREQQQDQLLDRVQGDLKKELVAAGVPEDLVTEKMLVSGLIAGGGDPAAAKQELLSFRDGILRGFTSNNDPGSRELDLPRGAPPTAPRRNGKYRDAFDEANVGAENMLRQRHQAAAQG